MAGNIAYSLALLGQKPLVVAAAGQDFGEYRTWMTQCGVDASGVHEVVSEFTAVAPAGACNSPRKSSPVSILMPPDTVMVPLQPRVKLKAPFSSVVVVDLSASHVTVAPLKWPLVATPDSEERLSEVVGQAVSKTGKVNAIHTRLRALGAERKPEAVMKISFGNDER